MVLAQSPSIRCLQNNFFQRGMPMPAIMTETMSGATTEPILDPTIPAIANQPVLPTVTYDGVTMTITAYVIVSFSNTDPSGLSIQAPLIAIPAATPASTSP